MNIARKTFIMPVKFYKSCINPLLRSNCKFIPSCSAYMSQAIEKRGVLIGIPMGIYRIIRCNPFTSGGFDPVKINYKGKAKWLL